MEIADLINILSLGHYGNCRIPFLITVKFKKNKSNNRKSMFILFTFKVYDQKFPNDKFT